MTPQEPTTQEAIEVLERVVVGLKNSQEGEQRQIDSTLLAIKQLKGILDTPSVDLQNANQIISEKEQAITDMKLKIDELDKENTELKKDRLTPIEAEQII